MTAWRRALPAIAAVGVLGLGPGLAGAPVAAAVTPPAIDPGAAPPDGTPTPAGEVRQGAYCTRVGTLPGADYRAQPRWMSMLNLPAAWQFGRGAGVKVAVIDTGVARNSRLTHLVGGGDYVGGAGSGDGLDDCDAHGTIVASLIAAQPWDAAPAPAAPAGEPGGADAPPSPPAPPRGPDAFHGVAPEVELIAIRQSSQAFSPVAAFAEDDPVKRRKAGDIDSMARAIVHAADMGAQVINISEVSCMPANDIIEQRALGAAIRHAAVDKDAVIVAAAGNTSNQDCKQNPLAPAPSRADPRGWASVGTVVTPAWFSDHVLTVGAVDASGAPLADLSVAGPWVSLAAPGTDIVGLSPRGEGLINAVEGPQNTMVAPVGTSFSAAIVSGVAALVRARYPRLTAREVANRLLATAHAPGRGVDNLVGHGIVDPVAALTWDIPAGAPLAPRQGAARLEMPPPPPPRNWAPVWVALAGIGAVATGAASAVGAAAILRGRGR